jgi:hypothetical protein
MENTTQFDKHSYEHYKFTHSIKRYNITDQKLIDLISRINYNATTILKYHKITFRGTNRKNYFEYLIIIALKQLYNIDCNKIHHIMHVYSILYDIMLQHQDNECAELIINRNSKFYERKQLYIKVNERKLQR